MAGTGCDILMITYNRPEYTRLALARLLDTCDASMRVWIWHNGTDEPTLAVVRSMLGHPRIHEFHHSVENKRLNEPTNWLWANAKGDYLTKVDDDCLMPFGWGDKLRAAHEANPRFGVLGCWRFLDEDFVAKWARRKIITHAGGHRLMQSLWIEGSGYLMKRQCVEEQGLLGPNDSFPDYCFRLAERGWIHGWYYPFLPQEHMDDPRSQHSLMRCDEDVRRYAPLSAQARGVTTVAAWQAQLRQSARRAQAASCDLRDYRGWRKRARYYANAVKYRLGMEVFW